MGILASLILALSFAKVNSLFLVSSFPNYIRHCDLYAFCPSKIPLPVPALSRKRRMATEKCNAKTSVASFNMQDDSVQASQSIKRFESCHFGKTLAYRAVYCGSGNNGGTQHGGSRKARGNDARASTPSRLSKVSVATDN